MGSRSLDLSLIRSTPRQCVCVFAWWRGGVGVAGGEGSFTRCLVCLSVSRGFGSSGRWPHRVCLVPFVTSGSGDFELPQLSLPRHTLQSPLPQEPSTAVVQVFCETVIHLVCVLSVSLALSLSSFPQQKPRTSASAGSVGCSRTYPKQFDDQFSLTRLFSNAGLNTGCSLSHTITHSNDHSLHQWLGHTAVAKVVTGSFSKSCYLTWRVKVIVTPSS